MGQKQVICWWIPELLLRAHAGCYGRSIKAAEAVSPDVNVGVGSARCWEPRPAPHCSLASSQSGPTTIVLHLYYFFLNSYLVVRQQLYCGGFPKVNLTEAVSLYESVFVKPVADHMTPCCTVWLGPDLQTFPASSGVSVTSTITLLLFYSHEPLCQSSQNQADGARWQQKACKSWIIWLEILFNYSTKWPSWIQINTCCLLYNMCKQLFQFSTNNE